MEIAQKTILIDMTPQELKNHILETIELLENNEYRVTAKAIEIAFDKELKQGG